jgi:phosphatidylglycerol:prolipoprotein diacylglycerol transferase
MSVAGMFLLFYGIFRFVIEFVRLPDTQIGYLAFGWLTMGQVLSMPMLLGGLLMLALGHSTAKGSDPRASVS